MTITKLVVLFNKDKILIGIGTAIIAFVFSAFANSGLSTLLVISGIAILINIALALIASYCLYDKSNLYKPEKLFRPLNLKETDKAILLHASFDPISRILEKLCNLKIYNIYGNRHDDEKSVKISNEIFPPHPDQVIVNPSHLTDESKSLDYIFAIASAHEVTTQQKRIDFFIESKRVLKDGGTLILCEQMRNWINFLFFNIGAFHFVTLNDWESAIAAAGLNVTAEESLTIWGTILYIRK